MRKRWLRSLALLLSVLLMSQAPISTLGAIQNTTEGQAHEAGNDGLEPSGKSLKELWDELMTSFDHAFDTLLAADQEEIEELAPIAGPIEEKLTHQIYGLAEEEQRDAAAQEKVGETEAANTYRRPQPRGPVDVWLNDRTDPVTGEIYYEGHTSGAGSFRLSDGTYHFRDVDLLAGDSGLEIHGEVILYIDGNVKVEGRQSGINITENSSLILRGSGSLEAIGDFRHAGIHVPSTATLVIDMEGSLKAIGGNGMEGGDGRGRTGGHGGFGAGAGIGGNGGAGGDNGGGTGASGENSGKIILLGNLKELTAIGGSGGNGGNGASGVAGKVTSAFLYISLESGDGGGGGGGGGYPAKGIGGGGAGGGGGTHGGAGRSAEGSVNEWVTTLNGGDGGNGGRGYRDGGGGGGGGEAQNSGVATQRGTGGSGGRGSNGTEWATGGADSVSIPGKLGELAQGLAGLGGYPSRGGVPGQTGGHCGEIYRMTTATELPWGLYGGGGGPSTGNPPKIGLIYDLKDPRVDVSYDSPLTYTGQPLTPNPTVRWQGSTVISPVNYDVRYENNVSVTAKNGGTPEEKARLFIKGGYDKNDPLNTSRLAYDSIVHEFSITRAAITPSISAIDSVVYGTGFTASVIGNPGNADVTGWRFAAGSGTITEVSNGVVRVTPDKTGNVVLTANVAECDNYMSATASSKNITVMGKSIEAATVEVIPQQTYTGNSITPEPQVYVGGVKLKPGEEYSLNYRNNINQGTATVIITGKGNYYSLKNGAPVSVSADFTIVPRSIGDTGVTAAAITPVTYDGTEKKPELRLTYNGKTLKAGTDYTVEYANNINAGTDSGTILVTGKGNYRGLRQDKFSILPASISQTAVEVGQVAPVEFSGLKQEPVLTVTYLQGDGTRVSLAKETDYTVTYSGNLTSGTAGMTIWGKGNFKDSRPSSFVITPKVLSVKGDDKFLEYGTGIANPPFTYTVTGAVSGYAPVFEGRLTRETPTQFTQGVYKIIQDSSGPLKLSNAAVNKNYSFDNRVNYENGYLTITSTSNITETAELKIKKNGVLTAAAPDGDEGWYRSTVYICAPAGFQISSSNSLAATNVWGETLSYSDGDYSKAGVSYFLRKSDGTISDVKNITYKQDCLAPEGNIVAGGAAWHGYGSEISYSSYYNKKTPVTIFGSDGLSGVPMDNDDSVTETGIRYLITEDKLTIPQLLAKPDADWKRGEKFDFDHPKGIIYVEIRDRAGNKTYIHSDGLIYDAQKPSLTITRQPVINGWTDELVPVIEGTITDPLANLKERYVTYEVGTDRSGALTYGYPFEIRCGVGGSFRVELPDLEDGKYQIRISAADNAGNIESKTVPLWIDRTKPVFDFSSPVIAPGSEWTNRDIIITPAVSDATSGLRKTEYSLNNGANWRVYDRSFRIQTDGYFSEILLRAEDMSGNQMITLPGQLPVRRDTRLPAAPSVSVKGSASSNDISGNTWFRGEQSPILSMALPVYTDAEAPVKVMWKLWREGTGEPAVWSEGVSTRLTSEGVWTLLCKAVDEAGNESTATRMTVRWDKSAPVFDGSGAWTVETVNTGTAAQVANSVSFGMFYQEALKVTIHVGDNGGSGLAALTYSLNGQTPTAIDLTSKSFNLPVGTKGTIAVQAVDGAGNVTSVMLLNADGNGNLLIENTPPVIRVTQDNSPNKKGWYNQKVRVNVEVYDEDSGIASILGSIGQNSINKELNKKEQIKNHRFQVELGEGTDILYALTVTDNAGLQAGVSLTAGNGFQVDQTPPTAGMRLDMPYDSMTKFYGIPVKVEFSATDEHSQVSAYSYTIDNGVTWSGKISWPGAGSPAPSITLTEDGTYQVGLKVWDHADNEALVYKLHINQNDGSPEAISNQITLDRVAPEVPVFHVEPGAGGILNEAGWYNGEEPVFSLKMPDGKSGLSEEKAYWYAAPETNKTIGIADRLEWNVRDGLISVPRSDWGATTVSTSGKEALVYGDPVEGAFDFYYYSRDAAGNESALKKETVRWDNSAPVFGDFTFTAENGDAIDGILNYLSYGNYYTSAVKVSVPVTDPVNPSSDPGDLHVPEKTSGIKSVTYSINGEQPREAAVDNGKRSFLIPKDTKGKITITAVDVAGNTTSTYVLGSDGSNEWALESVLPDIGPINPSEADDAAGSDGNMWYTAPVTFTSEITDTGSGIRKVDAVHTKGDKIGGTQDETLSSKSYDIGGSVFQSTYTWSENSGSGEGNPYTVSLRAEDNSGNTQSREQAFYIDLTKPLVNLTLGGGRTYPEWSGVNTLTVGAADEVSGVDGLSYTFDGGQVWSERESYDGSSKVIIVPDNAYPEGALGVRVWDVAGNCYDTLQEGDDLRFNTDTQSPPSGILTVEPGTDGAFVTEHGEEWYNGMTGPQLTITVEPGDGSRAPVHYYWCIKPEGENAPLASETDQWTRDSGERLVLPGEGRYVLYWYTEDEAGNAQDKTAPKAQIIRYDKTKISYEAEEVTFSKVNTGAAARMGNFITGGNYFNEAVRITMYTADTGSHPAQMYYSLDMGNTWKTMKTDSQPSDEKRNFYFDMLTGTDGTVQVWYYAVDRAGNQEEVRKLKGQSGSLEWVAENRGPAISEYVYEETVNDAGWFNQTVHVNVDITDKQSGVSEGIVSCLLEGEAEKILDSNNWTDHAPVETKVSLAPVIDFDCTSLPVTVTAVDNSGNQSAYTERISRDTVNPKIENMEGWPDKAVNSQPVVSFSVNDERSGIIIESVAVKKDGDITIPVTYDVKDNWTIDCSFEMDGNGHYLISVTDIAGNTSTFERDETLIDTAGVKSASLSVLLNPTLPDGENDWYTSTPTIEIQPVVQTGASSLTTWYTLYLEGEEEPEGTVFLVTKGVGTTGAEEKTVQQPQIPGDGRWKLHVWIENVFGDSLEYETLIKVDTENPYELTIGNIPKEKAFKAAHEVWINRDKSLSAEAKDDTSGVYTWCYSLDKGASWTGWRDWTVQEKIKIDRDVGSENSILFRVRDEAGNETVSDAVTVLRDTEEPWLYLALADGMSTTINIDEPLLFYMNEEVWKLPTNNGRVRVWDYASRTLYCEVKAKDDDIFINRHDNTIEVKLPVQLEPGTRYYVDVLPNFVTDQAGNVNSTCGGYGVWEFTTEGDRKPETVIQGFQVDLTSGTPKDHMVRSMHAVRQDNGRQYHVIAKPEYILNPDEAGLGMKSTVLDIKVLTKGSETVNLWTEHKDVQIEALEDNQFHLTIPEGVGRLPLYAAPEEAEPDADAVILTVIQSGISARATGDLRPVIDESEVVNRIKLNHELDDTARHIDLNLTVERKNQNFVETETKAARHMLGGKLPEGSKAYSLDIGLIKEVRTEKGAIDRTSVHNLEGPIHVTMDLESGLRNFDNLLILRIHNDQAGYIRPEKLDGGTRIRFKTDRFSEYILIGSSELLIPEQRTDGITTITAEAERTHPDKDETELSSQVSGKATFDDWQFPWWILILAAILLITSYVYYRQEKRQNEEADDEDDEWDDL